VKSTQITDFWNKFAVLSSGETFNGLAQYHDGVKVDYNGITIYFDHFDLWSGKFSSTLTRVYAQFSSLDNFKFKIDSSSLTSKISEFFGSQDIKIGRKEFDDKFIIKSNNEFKIKKILDNPNTRACLSSIDDVHLEISDSNGIWEGNLSDGKLELSFYFDEIINDSDRLIPILILFRYIIDDLQEMKSVH